MALRIGLRAIVGSHRPRPRVFRNGTKSSCVGNSGALIRGEKKISRATESHPVAWATDTIDKLITMRKKPEVRFFIVVTAGDDNRPVKVRKVIRLARLHHGWFAACFARSWFDLV